MSAEHRETTITCPVCGHTESLRLREGIRHEVAWCPACGAKLTLASGECCVPCVYGNWPCLPAQRARMLTLTPERFWRLVDADRDTDGA